MIALTAKPAVLNRGLEMSWRDPLFVQGDGSCVLWELIPIASEWLD